MNSKRYVEEFFLDSDPEMPNNPSLPVVIYRYLIPSNLPRKDTFFKDRFIANGWAGVWSDSVYDYHHFHPNAHEALAIVRGRVDILVGGASGRTVKLKPGDLMVLPAGTGHKRVDASKSPLVIGAYPLGQENYDTCRSLAECPDAAARISRVALPEQDPFYGGADPLLTIWAPKDGDDDIFKGKISADQIAERVSGKGSFKLR